MKISSFVWQNIAYRGGKGVPRRAMAWNVDILVTKGAMQNCMTLVQLILPEQQGSEKEESEKRERKVQMYTLKSTNLI